MTPLATKVYEAIDKSIKADKLVLPTMPEMAVKVREISDDANASIKQLGDVISGDAALTARIIKVANSPIYRGSTDIEDLNMALMRLGMATTASLATGLAMQQMFQATTDMVDKRLRQVWNESSEIAGICTVLCKHAARTLRPDQAALAGLVHKIGVLPILSFAEDHPALLRDAMTLDSLINEIHPLIGVRILTTWEFPADIQKVPSNHLAFERKAPAPDYSDIVTVAMLQSLCSAGKRYGDLDYTTVTAFERLGLDPDIENTEAEDLTAEMEAAMAMLK